jgi:hypothetical protein
VRNYPALDARLETAEGRVIFERFFKNRHFELGSMKDWGLPGPRPAGCREPG